MIIIIGSSKGLGKSIHKMFADKRLLLVSRTSTKVESENHFHIECDINNFDYSKIGKILEDEEISLKITVQAEDEFGEAIEIEGVIAYESFEYLLTDIVT